MTNDNRIVQGLWVEGRLTELERLCIRSFCANGHEFHLYHYGELSNLPKADGLRLMDGGDILPKERVFSPHGSVDNFSDLFRWELLRRHGGWWSDMDICLLRPLDITAETYFIRWDADNLSSSLLKFPKGHFMPKLMADVCSNPNKIMPWDSRRIVRRKIVRRLKFWQNARKGQGVPRGEAGLIGLAGAARHFGIMDNAAPTWHIHLIERYQMEALFNEELHETGILPPLLENAYGVHFTNAGMRILGKDKDATFPPNSPYEILKRRYPEQ